MEKESAQVYANETGFQVRLEARVKNAALVSAREQLGLTVKAAAEGMGLSPSTLCYFENLRKYPASETMKKICEFYRRKGVFILEEDVFPEELRDVCAQTIVAQAEVPRQELPRLSTVRRNLLTITGGIDDWIEQEHVQATVQNYLSRLGQRAQRILELRYGFGGVEPHSFEQIARKFGLSRSRVMQLESNALGMIRNLMEKDKLYGPALSKAMDGLDSQQARVIDGCISIGSTRHLTLGQLETLADAIEKIRSYSEVALNQFWARVSK